MEITNLMVNFVITIVFYCSFPLILRVIEKKTYEDKKAKKIAVINSIVAYILTSIVIIFVIGDVRVANIAPAILWGIVSYYILRKKTDETEEKEDNQLTELINKLEKEKEKQ